MDLLKYVGETSFYEKKVKLETNKPKSWLKSVSAFANSNGGKLFFGIDDNDNLIGLKNAKEDSEYISNAIKAKLDPIPEVDLKIEKVDEKDFIMLDVKKGIQTPYYYINDGTRLAYLRIGNESVLANGNQLNDLILKGHNKSFDSLVTNIKVDKASFTKFKSMYYFKTHKDLDENFLVSFNLSSDDGYLTNAGALFADEPLVYQSRIFATRWNGLDKTNGKFEAFDDKEFSGSLLSLLQNGEEFIMMNSKKMWRKGPKNRIEYPDYPEIPVREALVNALIHRNYNEIGSEIHIDMFDDRLEIYSPGGMPDGSFIQNQNPKEVPSKRRNPFIADIFGRMNLMERSGSGLRKIIDNYKIHENYSEQFMPVFKSTNSSFYIILKNLNYNNKLIKNDFKESKNISKENDILFTLSDERKNKIILFAKENKYFTRKDIDNLLNLKYSQTRSLLSDLVSNNILEPKGDNKNRTYTLKNIKIK
ncbi:ATP-binding protein [Mycoplasma sp. OR1901]|uniref:ATP-binding protein n=1 Tax=Mycoplasma sp. OR1901 TaxID=2742195 RepID=UPI001582A84E|nr:ATP-binding protein [Mycoplasma sp. OR1901]QKT05505.1 putative DNA binding domain-containing protein [Mycoplasma sp. OR1901]